MTDTENAAPPEAAAEPEAPVAEPTAEAPVDPELPPAAAEGPAPDPLNFETLLAARGINVQHAKERLATLAGIFPRDEPNRKYGIPDGTIQRYLDETFGSITLRQVCEDVARHWERQTRGE